MRPRVNCPFCLERFHPPMNDERFIRHLKDGHHWHRSRALQFIDAQEQCRAPEWMQRKRLPMPA